MHGLDTWSWLTTAISDSSGLPSLLGYMGLGQGPELIPYFAALVSFVGAALVAVLQWPLSVLFGLLRAKRRGTELPRPGAADVPRPDTGGEE